jgi:hypothetical protein
VPPHLSLTTGPTAARAHERGVEELLAGRFAAAAADFRQAVAEDPCFAVGHASLAVALAAMDDEELEEAVESLASARRCSRRLSRRERHHVEVVTLALGPRADRAAVLGREHLADFPDDAVARFVLARWCGDDVAPPVLQ